MAKWKGNEQFRKQLDLMKKSINSVKKDMQFLRIDLPELICEVFVHRARTRLKYAGGAEYVNNINYVVNGDGTCEITVTENQEGIMTFLEYGTGIIGSQYKHPEAKVTGWRYAIHRDQYKYVKGIGHGWFFQKTATNYVSHRDSYIPEHNTVFSRGILPARYMYDTKKEIEDAYNSSKTVYDFVKKLTNLKGKAVV